MSSMHGEHCRFCKVSELEEIVVTDGQRNGETLYRCRDTAKCQKRQIMARDQMDLFAQQEVMF